MEFYCLRFALCLLLVGAGGCANVPIWSSPTSDRPAMAPAAEESAQAPVSLPSVRLENEITVPFRAGESAVYAIAAVGRDGRLYIFLRTVKSGEGLLQTSTTSGQYLVLDNHGISVLGDTLGASAPLDAAGELHAYVPALVETSTFGPCGPAGHEIVCGYITRGPETGAPRRWQLWIAPGPGVAFPFALPLHYRPGKVVLARVSAGVWVPFGALDPLSARTAEIFKLAGDHSGNVHILYADHGDDGLRSLAYALIKPLPPTATPAEPQGAGLVQVVNGQVVSNSFTFTDFDMAVEPGTGSAFIAFVTDKIALTQLVAGERSGPPSVLAEGAVAVRVAPAGAGGFHTLIATTDGRVIYRLMISGVASKEIDLGTWSSGKSSSDSPGSAQFLPEVFAIAADTSGKAFAVWNDDSGSLRVRGITLPQQESIRRSRSRTAARKPIGQDQKCFVRIPCGP